MRNYTNWNLFASLELCERKDDNVVILDWSKYSGANSTNLNIIKIYQNSEKIGRFLAECIKKLVNAGLNENEIYLIGFSLGAHIAGFPGKCSNVTVSRITGTCILFLLLIFVTLHNWFLSNNVFYFLFILIYHEFVRNPKEFIIYDFVWCT